MCQLVRQCLEKYTLFPNMNFLQLTADSPTARLVLNYKQLPYRTEWVTHPEIAPKMESLGIPPNSKGNPYTVPVIILPDGTPVMESTKIAQTLESLHPQPSLHLETGLHEQCSQILDKIVFPLIAVFMPRVPRTMLVESSVDWFREAREKTFGNLDDMERERGGDKAWAAAKPGFEEMDKFLTEHKVDEGPFVKGSQVSYSDFMIMSLLEGFRRIGKDIFEGFVAQEKRLGDLHEACKKWTENDQ